MSGTQKQGAKVSLENCEAGIVLKAFFILSNFCLVVPVELVPIETKSVCISPFYTTLLKIVSI